MTRFLSGLIAILLTSAPLQAQQWNSPDALALARRGIARRELTQADTTLRSYRTVAHGFVFFLAQVGEGLQEPPRLVKADELKLEVYWRAPDLSKQVILGWRDGTWLPTDIEYHRDHLGIVTNNFGDLIRIGEGDEVRDVVHPLAPAGPSLYDFALEDSLSVQTGRRQIRVVALAVRPKAFGRPGVVGTLFLDTETAEVVRFRFSFTPAAYRDRDLEDISIALENSLWDGRYWLPYRQEIEIRRRTTWLDFPARGIIRGRWEIQEYEFNVPVPPRVLAGPPIGGLRDAEPSQDSAWGGSLADAVAEVARPVTEQDMAALRVEVERIAGARALSGLASRRIAAGSVSDLVRVNRVQGLALGFGGVLGVSGSRITLRPSVGYGTADDRLTGELTAAASIGASEVWATGSRRVRDFSDIRVIAGVTNSLTAQEGGDDHGDYVLVNYAGVGVRHRFGGRTSAALEVGVEESRSVGVHATPANGEYRANPQLGAGTYRVARLRLERASGGLAVRRDLQGAIQLEAGEGPTEYLRATAEGRWLADLGGSELLTRVYAGTGTAEMPAYRGFALGGRGTLVGEPFRGWWGRHAALAHLEWRIEAPVPAIPLGSFASTGRTMILAPFVAAGWTDEPAPGAAGVAADGIRPVAGVALEWFHRLIRVEAGVGLRTGEVGVTVDVNRDWWGVM